MRDRDRNHWPARTVLRAVALYLHEHHRYCQTTEASSTWLTLNELSEALSLRKRVVREALDGLTWRAVRGTPGLEEALTGEEDDAIAIIRRADRHHIWAYRPFAPAAPTRGPRSSRRPPDNRPPRGPGGKSRP